jgi:hypothetical protein
VDSFEPATRAETRRGAGFDPTRAVTCNVDCTFVINCTSQCHG